LKADLLAICDQRNILVTNEECQVKEGWLGKPKGMLQILWERGWIDSTKVVSGRSMRYSKDGKKEDFGEDRKVKDDKLQYVLTYLLSQCKDFKEEMCDLEFLAKELGGRDATISILFTSKYHCELAGEAIQEYCWGAAKRIFRKLPVKKKSLGIPSRPVLESASARSTSTCANDSQQRHEATCLAVITKPWKLKTEEKKSRVLSETRKSKTITDPTGMHLPSMVHSSHGSCENASISIDCCNGLLSTC
jgi:hypothetical protein